ncbi:MAG: glycerophosphodiester phosphodiesterase [Cyanobacteria bacterium REEB67]|nr:glycerophosphodiester phosphodiesterase [Cyanobacteria bacterium REEB67]
MIRSIRSPLVFAHRGGREWAPENTLAAFSNCLELGVDGIELNVQRCASGELVVIHDEDLGRTTNGGGLVADATLDEIKRLSAGLWFDRDFAGEKVPALTEVLALVAGRCALNIEIKNAPIAYDDIEVELLDLLGGYLANYPQAEVIVSSFDHQVIGRLARLLPAVGATASVKLALLADAVFVDLASYGAVLQTTYYHPCFGSLRADVVDAAHQAGMKVNTWTLNNRVQWLSALKMGVDGIVTDDPEGLMILLKRALPAGAISPLA